MAKLHCVSLIRATELFCLLLQSAVRDILFLKEKNDKLELKLKQAVEWELDIR